MLHFPAILLLLTFGCVWDSDTLRDEATVRPDIWEVISGQYPQHGFEYYRRRVLVLSAQASLDRTQRNDLAVAHLRRQQYDQAEKLLTSLQAEQPDDYEPLSNHAVLLRNQGRFAEAVPLFEQALKLHPDGHLGLGDWTLKAVIWQACVADEREYARRKDFLGRDRVPLDLFLRQNEAASLPWDKLPQERQDRLRLLTLLLRNYVKFAEGFLVLGDELAEAGDNQLALCAYARAFDLEHPATDLVREHFLAVASRIERWSGQLRGSVLERERTMGEISEQLRQQEVKSMVWRGAFIRLEGDALRRGEFPSFAETSARMAADGVSVYLPFTEADRRALIYSAWIEGIDLVKKKQWADAEPILAKACAQAKELMPKEGYRARLLIVYAASLSPQGGEKRLRAAAQALNEAESILRADSMIDHESIDLVLGNLEKVYAALGDDDKAAEAKDRRKKF